MTSSQLEFRILGPLDVRLDGESVALGGGKQRAVLAALLLSADEVIPVVRLVDEVWGDEAPPSASHSLEAYVSRIRRILNGHGPTLTRRGAGYCLALGPAELDAQVFTRRLQDASRAADDGNPERAAELATAALAVWRGPALADVALASAGRTEAERLEELRLRALEVRFDAELALGRHRDVVGELQALVGQNPYREQFVAQLMLALYCSGRHADALRAYERLRVSLDEEVGLQPSVELQRLSGRIVRQDPELTRPLAAPGPPAGRPRAARSRDLAGLAAAAVASIAAMAFTASASGARAHALPSPERMAVVLPGFASESELDAPARSLAHAVQSAENMYGVETASIYVAHDHAVAAAVRRIQEGRFGLAVVLGSGPTAKSFARVVAELPDTRFAFVDASLRELALERTSNAAAIRFAEDDSAYLAGYLSGLSPRRDDPVAAIDAVSIVAGVRDPRTVNVVSAFRRGVRAAARGVRVHVDYSREVADPTACESIANRRIDMGADVVFAAAGKCGLGALAVARFRGVWGVGSSDELELADHVLALTTKDWMRAAQQAVYGLVFDSFRDRREDVLGLEDEYAVALEMSHLVPDVVESRVIDRCSEIRVARVLGQTS